MNGRRRSGFSLVELLVAFFLLGTLLTIVAPVISWMSREQRSNDIQERGLLEVANVLEIAAVRPWDELTPEWAKGLQLSESFRARVPSAALQVTLETPPNESRTKRLVAEVTLNDSAGYRGKPIRLAGWFHAPHTEARP